MSTPWRRQHRELLPLLTEWARHTYGADWRVANLAAPDFSQGLRDVLSALEEQVVLMQVLGDASDESLLSVMIGRENPVEGLQTTSLVSSGYGSGGETLAKLAVLGPTRMDYPGTMGAVSAVARYVGEILMES